MLKYVLVIWRKYPTELPNPSRDEMPGHIDSHVLIQLQLNFFLEITNVSALWIVIIVVISNVVCEPEKTGGKIRCRSVCE